MRYIQRIFLVSSFLSILISSSAQSLKNQQQLITLKRVIEREHYSPRMLDDQFSSELFDRLIERLDERKLFFTADDIKQLSAYRFLLDDELKGAQWNFLDKIIPLFKWRLKSADSIVTQLTQRPFDFNQAEKIALIKDSIQFPTTDVQLKRKWHKWLKYETLARVENICLTKKTELKTCLQFEGEAREQVKALEIRNIKKMLEHPSGFEIILRRHFIALRRPRFELRVARPDGSRRTIRIFVDIEIGNDVVEIWPANGLGVTEAKQEIRLNVVREVHAGIITIVGLRRGGSSWLVLQLGSLK